jgi:hypothetical protein
MEKANQQVYGGSGLVQKDHLLHVTYMTLGPVQRQKLREEVVID